MAPRAAPHLHPFTLALWPPGTRLGPGSVGDTAGPGAPRRLAAGELPPPFSLEAQKSSTKRGCKLGSARFMWLRPV